LPVTTYSPVSFIIPSKTEDPSDLKIWPIVS